MNARQASLITLLAHVLLVCGIGGKYALDRARYPRAWVLAVPVDPDSLTRGRYVSLQLCPVSTQTSNEFPSPVKLRIDRGQLVADPAARDSRLHTVEVARLSRACLADPVAFYIPEHAPDPSRLRAGEELWVETSVPTSSMPRPVRLGIKRDGGPIEPLALR